MSNHRRFSPASGPRGYFGVGIYGGKTPENLGTLWRSASMFGAQFIATVGKRYGHQSSDTCKTYRHAPLFHYTDIDDLIEHIPYDCPLIGVELHPTAQPLSSYVHRERAFYLLGAEDHGLPNKVMDRCVELVQIDSPIEQSMNVSVAGSIVMHDRYIRSEQRLAVAS